MSFKPIQKLVVNRTLSSGEQVTVGVLAQNRQGVFFQYAEAISQFTYLAQQQGISKATVSAIAKTLDQRKQENAALFV